ncbi:mandelate racemase/muconate lactonizing enzyme family protein [Sphingomonas sp. PAMC 26617]|uniref:mandelate racemase/muconate lactonizing enzyme family protein n=1 Tax=Sphingomonas sp. PAMC 26617 TaxID=1112216 RepID=UPI00028868D9|nr:mandelate racemase/muconate lactonizing enzyme family protein [Sphingomonas sp. PAMC 26617]
MSDTMIVKFRITRFQFRRDRVIGDSQVRAEDANIATIELIDGDGRVGLGFAQTLFQPFPDEAEIVRVFTGEAWPRLEGREASSIALGLGRARGGNVRRMTLPFEEAIQHAVWDLFAKQNGLPLWRMLGEKRDSVPVYASGLDFHLSDHAFGELFGGAAAAGYRGFKIKVGHSDLERDVHRLDLLKRAVGDTRPVMIDANEAWTAREAIVALETFAKAGHSIYWAEDPIPRDDFDGLRMLRASGLTRINSGEYLDLGGKRRLIEARACDMLNVHGQVSDVMRAGWLAEEANIEVTFGNTFLEIGVNMALALPGVRWLEYSFQNFDHLVERPYTIVDGLITGSQEPGHGLILSETARREHRQPTLCALEALGEAPLPQRALAA